MTKQLENIVRRIKRAQAELKWLGPELPQSGWKVLVIHEVQVGDDGIPRFRSGADESGYIEPDHGLVVGCSAGLHAPVVCDEAAESILAVPIFDQRSYDPSPVLRSVLGVACYQCGLSAETVIKDDRLHDIAGKYAEIFSDATLDESPMHPQDGLGLNWPSRPIIDRCKALLDNPPRRVIAEIIAKALRAGMVSRVPTGASLSAAQSQLRAELGRRFGESVAKLLQPAFDALFRGDFGRPARINDWSAFKSAVESGVAAEDITETLSKESLATVTRILLRQAPERFLTAIFPEGAVIVDGLKRNWREFRRAYFAKDSDIAEYIHVMLLREDSATYLETLRSGPY